jgi:hypothetical protein
MVDVWDVSVWVPIWKNSLVSLIQNFDTAKSKVVLLECMRKVSMEHDEFRFVAKVTHNDCQILLALEHLPALGEDRRQLTKERFVIFDVA